LWAQPPFLLTEPPSGFDDFTPVSGLLEATPVSGFELVEPPSFVGDVVTALTDFLVDADLIVTAPPPSAEVAPVSGLLETAPVSGLEVVTPPSLVDTVATDFTLFLDAADLSGVDPLPSTDAAPVSGLVDTAPVSGLEVTKPPSLAEAAAKDRAAIIFAIPTGCVTPESEFDGLTPVSGLVEATPVSGFKLTVPVSEFDRTDFFNEFVIAAFAGATSTFPGKGFLPSAKLVVVIRPTPIAMAHSLKLKIMIIGPHYLVVNCRLLTFCIKMKQKLGNQSFTVKRALR
jgi:hypothetical protein